MRCTVGTENGIPKGKVARVGTRNSGPTYNPSHLGIWKVETGASPYVAVYSEVGRKVCKIKTLAYSLVSPKMPVSSINHCSPTGSKHSLFS